MPKEKSIVAIRNASEMGAEIVKREFLNKELSDEFSVSLQGGIRISRKNRVVFLIYREDGPHEESEYFSDNGTFIYQGMGQKGNQSFSYFGNRIIKDHVQEEFRLFLFRYSAEKTLNLVGEAFYKSHRVDIAEDYNNNKREVIYFELKVDKKANLPSSA